jgi:RNA polymerase sigma factor (sigma-70 family)
MANAHLRPVIHYLRKLALRSPPEERGDDELLHRFVDSRDEAAFAALVHRHGPMVFSLCRRVLRDAHEAEDCLQAVFLVLARKAAALLKPERLASWLYGVAYRTALKARTRSARRRKREIPLVDLPIVRNEDRIGQELRPVLDEEIHRLPVKYRLPVILCYLEGATNAEAARRLGWTRGTIATRLAWARRRLRSRLLRRGITLPVGALVALLSRQAAEASLPGKLAKTTIEAALRFAAGHTPTAGMTPVVLLAQGVLRTMTLSKLQFAALTVLTASAVGAGVGWLTGSFTSGERREVSPPVVALPTAPRNEADKSEGQIQEIAALRTEIEELKKRTIAPQAPAEAAAGKRETLLYQGKPPSFWLAALRDRDPEYRRKALTPLQSFAMVDHSLIPALIACLHDEDEGVRMMACGALGELGPPAKDAVPVLLQADLPVSCVVDALQWIDPKGQTAVPAALAALKDKRVEVRRNAAFTLFTFDKTKARLAVGEFAEALNRINEFYLASSAAAGGRSRSVAEVAATALGEIGPEAREAIPALVTALLSAPDRDSQPVPMSVTPFVAALKKVDPEGTVAVPLLVKKLEDKNAQARLRASMMLGQYAAKSASALSTLIPLIREEKDRSVALQHIETIGAMGSAASPAVPTLLDVVKHVRDIGNKAAAVSALGEIGSAAREAVPLLTEIVKKGNTGRAEWNELVDLARKALKKIDPEAAKAADQRPVPQP